MGQERATVAAARGTGCARQIGELDMPVALHHEDDNIYRLDISGTLFRTEFGQCEAEMMRELDRVGSARLLCVLSDFKGWEPKVDWNNLAFFVKHGNVITRIAIVGDERWRKSALMFAAADLRRAPVKFFPEAELAKARAWLTA